MSELKTLEELRNGFHVVGDRELREEAIRWIKKISNTKEERFCLTHQIGYNLFDKKHGQNCETLDNFDYECTDYDGAIKILKHFFNLTEEDLK